MLSLEFVTAISTHLAPWRRKIPKNSRIMASTVKLPAVPEADLKSFTEHLQGSTRILALLGAGLSAASGLPTFRGAGGLWRSHRAVSLATPGAFECDPGLVWQFYSYRRHMALQAKPNKAHYALAELAKRRKDFITLSQNIDGRSNAFLKPSCLRSLNMSRSMANCSPRF